MIIKKFWKLYPKSNKRQKIKNNRIKVKPKLRNELQKFGKNILMVRESMDMVDIIIIQSFLER